jgi:hypothetical protein
MNAENNYSARRAARGNRRFLKTAIDVEVAEIVAARKERPRRELEHQNTASADKRLTKAELVGEGPHPQFTRKVAGDRFRNYEVIAHIGGIIFVVLTALDASTGQPNVRPKRLQNYSGHFVRKRWKCAFVQ